MKFKRGDQVKIVTGSGSCLNGATGVIEEPVTMFGMSAWSVILDEPVTYPSGNAVKRDIVFNYEIERRAERGA